MTLQKSTAFMVGIAECFSVPIFYKPYLPIPIETLLHALWPSSLKEWLLL